MAEQKLIAENGFISANDTILNGAVTVNGSTTFTTNAPVVYNANVDLKTAVVANGAVTIANTLDVSGNVTVDTNLLVINTTNNRIGVNATPSGTEVLYVVGNSKFANSLSVEGDLQVTGSLTYSGTANGDYIPGVDDTYRLGNNTNRWIVFASDINASNTVTIANSTVTSLVVEVGTAGGNVGINTSAPNAKLQVVGTANISGDVRLGGTLITDGNTTISGTSHTVSGNTSFDGGTLYVDGANNKVGVACTVPVSTLDVVGTANVTGAVNLGSTLNVVGDTFVDTKLGVNTVAGSFALNVLGDVNLGNTTITGNLTVTGTTTYVNTNTLNIGDNIITLNADLGGGSAPTENSGIEINRGSSANVSLVWNETSDKWDIGNTNISGSANVSGTLQATGAATLGSTLSVTANASFTAAVAVSGNLVASAIGPFSANQVTIPNVVGDTFVTLAATQTLTNKTLTSPSVTNGSQTGTVTGDHTMSGNIAFTGTTVVAPRIGPSITQQHTLQAVANSTLAILGGVAQNFTSNVTISGANLAVSATNTTVTGTGLNVSANANFTGTNLTHNGNYIYRAGGTVVSMADGGANASLTPTGGAIVYSNTISLALTASPTVGQIILTGNSTVTVPTFRTLISGLTSNTTHIYVDHDAALNFVADEHIAHSGVNITAGNGLTGGGTIDASRSLAVVAGGAIVSNSTGVHHSDTSSVANVSTGTLQFVSALQFDTYGHVVLATNSAIQSSNTTVQGVVQLVDSVTNTSITIAPTANSVKTAYDNGGTAYSNAVSVASTDASNKAATAYSNAVSVASTDASNKAATAYSNATTFSANATNITNGTLNTARLPATANVTTAINVGANVNLTTSSINVGNSTVNTAITAGTLSIGGGLAANSTIVDFNGAVIADFVEDAAAATNTGTGLTISSTRNINRYILNNNATMTLPSSMPGKTDSVKSIILHFVQDATGGRTMTLAAPGGETISYNNSASQPPVASGANKVTIYTATKFHGDTVWYVSLSFIQV